MFKRFKKRKTARLYSTLKGLLSGPNEISPDYERVTLPNGDTVLRRVTPVPQLNTPEPAEPRTLVLCTDKDGNGVLKEIK